MGYYVNPKDMEKEEWLAKHGQAIPLCDALGLDFDEFLPVCLVDNGPFTAAGIGFDKREAMDFARPDGRPKTWYRVRRLDLEPFMC